MKLLIDGDILPYRIGFACESKDDEGNITAEPLEYVLHTIKVFMKGLLEDTKADSYTVFLTGGGNFRSVVDPMYKMNRKDKTKPIHYKAIREFLTSRYGAKVIEGAEADDALACNQTNDTVIATIDKDLLMVAGRHYNFVKKEYKEVTEEGGDRFFYKQMLTGDGVDNICGIKGLGDKKADKLLDAVKRECWDDLIMSEYEKFHSKAVDAIECMKNSELKLQKNYDYTAFARYTPFQRLCMNSQLLWMIQKDKKMPIDILRLSGYEIPK